MEDVLLVFIKKIELKLENSIDDAIKAMEPLLSAYKGAKIQFKEKSTGVTAGFNIGSGAKISNALIMIKKTPENTSLMTLEVSSPNNATSQGSVEQTTRKLDILIEDILIHIITGLEIKEKAKLIEKGKKCPNCKNVTEITGKFCNNCGYNFEDRSLPSPKIPKKPPAPLKKPPNKEEKLPTIEIIPPEPAKLPPKPSPSPKGFFPKETKPLTPEEISNKYPKQYECSLCDFRCAYKEDFIMLLSNSRDLEEPFKKFDEFLRKKDIIMFSDYIYDFTLDQMKKYPKYSPNEIPAIAFCIFSILSFHILEKASEKIRLTFAKKMKDRINIRFNKENPLISSSSLMETEITSPHPTIKTGSLRIEENRCPYCYKKFDERTLRLKVKGYIVECENCGNLL